MRSVGKAGDLGRGQAVKVCVAVFRSVGFIPGQQRTMGESQGIW